MQIQPFTFKELQEGADMPKRPPRPFQSGRTKEEAPAVPPPPTFSEEQMKVAERDGYKKGFLEGTAEGKAQAESEQAETDRQLRLYVEQFAQQVEPLFSSHRDTVLRLRASVPKIALAIARKVAGQALSENALSVIEAMASQACETLTHEPKLSISVPESHADALEQKLQQMAGRLPAHVEITIIRDASMPLSDCRIEWQYGDMARNTEKLWKDVEAAVEGMTVTETRAANAQMDALQHTMTDTPTTLTQPKE